MEQDPDQWKYISLVAHDHCQTFDFKFRNRADATEFIIAVSKACSVLQGSQFVAITNRSLITKLMLKAKLIRMAKNINTSVHGLFAKAILLTVLQRFPNKKFSEKKIKYETLSFLIKTCLRCSVKLNSSTPEDKEGNSSLRFCIE